MPLHKQTFITRTITAIIFAAVMLAGLLLDQWIFIILFTIIHFGCWYEFIKLLKKIYPTKYLNIIPLGLIYITTPVLMMIDLRITNNNSLHENELAKVIPQIIIFSIWINDTMAYIVGSFIGKTPFSKISPKKTWEGTLGGAILCVGVIGLLGWWTQIYTIKDWIIISTLCAVFGTIGDLFQSKLKRLAGVKDSGTIMPGHGGFLDRFDSFLFAAPAVWLYVYLFMR